MLPVVGRPDEAPVRIVMRSRCFANAPRQRAVAGLALPDERAGDRSRALEAEVHVAGERERHGVRVVSVGATDCLVVAGLGVLPAAQGPAVVEDRLAVERQLHLAVHAANLAQQDVLGVIVRWRAMVRSRAFIGVRPRPDEEHVPDDDPAGWRAPARLEDVRARKVAASRWNGGVGGPEAKAAGIAIEDGPEHARRVHARDAHPLDIAAGRHERRRLAVGQEGVVGDRRIARARPSVAAHEVIGGARIEAGARGLVAVVPVVHLAHVRRRASDAGRQSRTAAQGVPVPRPRH